jgi:predicted DNA-binding transcriptional regulator YafY
MRRADRLFQIVLFLRRRRVSTARELAAALEDFLLTLPRGGGRDFGDRGA